jgi:hypothetical protein
MQLNLLRIVSILVLAVVAVVGIGTGWHPTAVLAVILLIPITLLIAEGVAPKVRTAAAGGTAPAGATPLGAADWVRGISGVFTLQLLYLAVLVVLGLGLFGDQKTPWLPGVGPAALGVAWFGALGAVTISIAAMSEHRHDWDPEWWYWHALRPFAGAILGSVSVLFFAAGILAVQQQSAITTGGATASSNLLYYVIAFTVGYREESFRELVKRIVDIVFKPGATATTPAITNVDPPSGKPGIQVVISGSNLANVLSVSFGQLDGSIVSKTDTQLTVNTPNKASPGEVDITVRTSNASASGQKFTFT